MKALKLNFGKTIFFIAFFGLISTFISCSKDDEEDETWEEQIKKEEQTQEKNYKIAEERAFVVIDSHAKQLNDYAKKYNLEDKYNKTLKDIKDNNIEAIKKDEYYKTFETVAKIGDKGIFRKLDNEQLHMIIGETLGKAISLRKYPPIYNFLSSYVILVEKTLVYGGNVGLSKLNREIAQINIKNNKKDINEGKLEYIKTYDRAYPIRLEELEKDKINLQKKYNELPLEFKKAVDEKLKPIPFFSIIFDGIK